MGRTPVPCPHVSRSRMLSLSILAPLVRSPPFPQSNRPCPTMLLPPTLAAPGHSRHDNATALIRHPPVSVIGCSSSVPRAPSREAMSRQPCHPDWLAFLQLPPTPATQRPPPSSTLAHRWQARRCPHQATCRSPDRVRVQTPVRACLFKAVISCPSPTC
jgi:hypothetical protein